MAEPEYWGTDDGPPELDGVGAVSVVDALDDGERWAETAAEVSRQLRRYAHTLTDDSVVWLAPVATVAGGRPVLLGPHLYDGSCGVALFLAAHHRVSGAAADREVALAAVLPLRRKLRQLCADPERSAALRLGVGGLVGVGSFVYALAHLAVWLDDAELLADAAACLPLFDAARIAADERFDVMSGCAGGVLALLALERLAALAGEAATAEAALVAATACAARLLDARVSWRGGPRAWPGPEGRPPLSGFAHGAAGIAYALLRLYQRSGADAHRRAAVEALAFERNLYLPQDDGWLDPRFDRPVEQSAWCHGTPGIALGRVGSLDVCDDDETQEELERLLRSTASLPMMRRDHLCCGNACRVEVLHAAALALGRDELAAAAGRLAAAMLERAQASGGFVVESPADSAAAADLFSPSLFLGAAGVGYTFLRLAHPEALPCLLLME